MRRLSFVALLALLPLAFSAHAARRATAAASAKQPAAPVSIESPSNAPAPADAAPAASPVAASATAAPVASASAPLPAGSAPAKITYSQCNVDGPYIAMTYDDGPHATNTPRLLDMLKQRGIKATFFLVGECAAEYPAIVKRIVAEGHEIANHSWSHPQLSVMGDEAVKSQLQRTHDAIIAGSGGVAPHIMRPPYGAFTERQRKWCNGEFGYKVILWDVDPDDWKYRNAARVHSEILRQTHAGSIILSHDIHKTTVDAMPQTLDDLAAKGFKFVTVSELLAMDRPKAKATPKPAQSASPAPSPESFAPTAAPATQETTSAPGAPLAPAGASTTAR